MVIHGVSCEILDSLFLLWHLFMSEPRSHSTATFDSFNLTLFLPVFLLFFKFSHCLVLFLLRPITKNKTLFSRVFSNITDKSMILSSHLLNLDECVSVCFNASA